MKVFIHYKQQHLEIFLQSLNGLNNNYITRSYEFDQNLINFLDNIHEHFARLGESVDAAEISRLKTYFVTAQKGVNPQSLEKLRIGRRENIWASAFYCMDKLSELLQQNLQKQNILLNEASDVIQQLVLSMLQSKFIDKEMLQKVDSPEHIQSLWGKMLENEQIDLMNMKLKLSVHQQDIYLLLEKIITRLM